MKGIVIESCPVCKCKLVEPAENCRRCGCRLLLLEKICREARQQKRQQLTISISADVKRDLFHFVKNRGISQFVSEAIVEKLESKKLSLEEQYNLAAQDEERNKEFKEWDDTMAGDGLNDSC